MDAIEEWSRSQQRVIDLVSGATAEQHESSVPACPDWTVRNLLAHMVGLGADVLGGDEPDDHNAEWTQKQVDRRADSSVHELVAEWRELAGPMRQWMADNDTRPLGDVVIHEQDLRGALRSSGAQDTDGLISLRERFVGGLADRIDSAGLSPLELRGHQWSWTSHDGTDVTVVRANDFDLTRALMSRRSADQLASWTVTGDVTPYLDLFAALGPLPERDLTETF